MSPNGILPVSKNMYVRSMCTAGSFPKTRPFIDNREKNRTKTNTEKTARIIISKIVSLSNDSIEIVFSKLIEASFHQKYGHIIINKDKTKRGIIGKFRD
jgi:hypothetical protein